MLLLAGRNSLLELFPFAPVVYLHGELVHPRTKQNKLKESFDILRQGRKSTFYKVS